MDKFRNLKPVIRFNGFKDDWNVSKLKELGEFKNGINKSKDDFGFGVPFVNLMDVFGKPVVSTLDLNLVNASKEEQVSYNLMKGDILFIRSSVKKEGVGMTSLLLEDLPNTVYSGFLIRFRTADNILGLDYKKYCFNVRRFRKNLLSLSTSSANTNINQESLNEIELHFPSLKEQQKIASFLSSVDEWITNLKSQKEALEKYKKGMMQKIFSQQIRFKDENGNDYPEWEEKKLGDVAYKNASSISVGSLSNNNGSHAIYGATGIIKRVDFYKEEDAYIGIVKDGAGIGRHFMAEAKSSVIGTLDIIKPKIGVDLYYLYYLIKQINFDKYKTGLAIPHIYFKDYSNEIITIPSLLTEQNKIASFLSSIDGMIDAKQKQIEKAERWKKGLMQQMFI